MTMNARSSSKPGIPHGNTKMSDSLYEQVPQRGSSTVFKAFSAGAFTMWLLFLLEIIDDRLPLEAGRRRVGGLKGGLHERKLRSRLGDVRVRNSGLRISIVVRQRLNLSRGPGEVLDLLPDLSPGGQYLVNDRVDVADLRREVSRHADLAWNLEGREEVPGGRSRGRHGRGRTGCDDRRA